MHIYYFKSDLFKGQIRKIVSSFPIPIDLLFDIVNHDNDYPSEGKWYCCEER